MKEFGGGTYWAQLLVQDGTGKEGIKQQRKFLLSGAYRPPRGDLPGIREPVSQSVGSMPMLPTGGDMASMLNATVMTTFIDLIKTMKEVSTRPAQAADPMMLELMRSQATVQTKVLELLLTKDNGAKPDSKKEILELMESMKNLIAPPLPPPPAADPNTVLTSVVNAIRQLREVSDEVGPDRGGSGDPFMDSIPKLAEVLLAETNRRKQAAGIPVNLKPSPVEPSTVPEVGTLPADTPVWRRVLLQQSKLLLTSAAAGRNPELIASMAIDFAPNNIKGVVTEFFNRPIEEVVAQIIQEIPGMGEFPQWLAEFVGHAQYELSPEEETEDADAAEGNK